MAKRKFRYLTLILTVVAFVLAIAAESVYLGDFEYSYRTKRFNRILHEKESIMDECLTGMKSILAKAESHGSTSENRISEIAGQNNITILKYIDEKLIYWSDNDFDVPHTLVDSIYKQPLVFLQNGWFLTRSVRAGNERIVALLRLRSDFGFENDIIKNGFLKIFGVPAKTGLSFNMKASGFRIYSDDGTFLFTLIYPEVKDKTFLIFIPLMLWGLSFILLLILIYRLAMYFAARKRNSIAVISSTLSLSLIYLIILFFRKPAVLFQTELFSPYRYTMNGFIPSLGHLFLVSIMLSFLAFVFYKYLPVRIKTGKTGNTGYTALTLMLVPCALLFMLFHQVFSDLVFNSTINFETFKVLDMNFFSLTGFVSIALLFGIPFLYMLKVFDSVNVSKTGTMILSLLTSIIILIPFFLTQPGMLAVLSLFYFCIASTIWFSKRKDTGIFNQTAICSLIFGLYSLFLITFLSERRTEENVKIQLVTYSTENDPIAEHLLLDMWPKISVDTTLKRMMDVKYFEKNDVDDISDYLHDNYFDGYWGNFNFKVVLCMKGDSLRIAGRIHGETYEDCFGFFEKRIAMSGHQLTGTGFYFIDNKQGRSNYLGQVYFDHGEKRINGLFIDLYSDINVFQPGYSELLFDKKYHSYTRLKNYSFAKYINGELVLRTGDFSYSKTDAAYIENISDYRVFNAEKYRHVLYRTGNVTVIISRPAISARDMIVSFAYLFIFILICSNIILLLVRRPKLKTLFVFNFRQKLQLSFIGILLFSFALVGIVVVSLAIKQYKTKHYENLSEKLNSVNMELGSLLSMEKRLTPDWKNGAYGSLDEVLVMLSNTFNTDINLYDRFGYLLATSRPEIFYRDLTSRRINNIAFNNLTSLNRSEYFQRERIGNLRFVSAYVPFYNLDDELLAYLNLPYFRMQSVLSAEISNMIMAVINFTLLLIIISMSLAVFISNRLTSPLKMLSNRLGSVELGKKSEHLSYNGKDEVGDLVRQYNHMVDELDDSARKLANSEREYAWREMAKQIAHEIKNPLTPMKLNTQQLYKSWKDGASGFEKKLEKFTRNQIEYIDNLSSIASAFSSFAKIPEAKPVRFDIIELMRTTVELFKNSDNITFRIGWPYDKKYYILADREQVRGIFSNIIKNAIQSIPPGCEGIVKVSITVADSKIEVSVADNGAGIPNSLKSKMFTPNFTTKSSGTGLGLSIAQRYAENAGGRIWFESEPDKGSVFYIEFPLLDVEKISENKPPV